VVSSCQEDDIYGDCYDSAGNITSGAYNLGNGLYLYAYRVQSAFCYNAVWIDGGQHGVNCLLAAVHLTVPLGGNAPVASGAVTSGVYWVGTLSSAQADYSICDDYQSAFTWFNPTDVWGYLCEEVQTDPLTAATVDNQTSPTAVRFTFPGMNAADCDITCPLISDTPRSTGDPYAVTLATPVFGFISSVPPTIVNGQFASDSSGNLLPAFNMVVPTVITMVDPDPDLLVTNSGSSGSGPSVTVTTNANSLATGGRPVQAVAADGVADVLLKIPAGAVGQQFTLTLEGDQEASYSSLNEDGGFADPTIGSTNFTQSVTVTAVSVNTPQGPTPMAFALYQPPKDFPRPGNNEDPGATSRIENVEFASSSGATPGIPPALAITIIRPPVVLIHGLWGDKNDWDNFSPLYPPAAGDNRFSISRIDYNILLGSGITSTDPDYGIWESLAVSEASFNSMGFFFNAPYILQQINEGVLPDFRGGANPLGLNAAAAQVDIVAHSMGGDITRTMPQAPDYLSTQNYDRGIVHKLITIGTPHFGSPLATDLLPIQGTNPSDPNECVRTILAVGGGESSFISATTTNGVVFSGGVGDLSGNGLGGSQSPALQAMEKPGPTMPVFPIAGTMSDSNLGGVGLTPQAQFIQAFCAGEPLALALSPAGWPTLFPGATTDDSDGVVPWLSQIDGLQAAGQSQTEPGVIHSGALVDLGFGLPGEPSDGPVAHDVINMLNTPVTSTQFTQVP
jgi:pimeloyl-ACP methyl ester carboxylesterase